MQTPITANTQEVYDFVNQELASKGLDTSYAKGLIDIFIQNKDTYRYFKSGDVSAFKKYIKDNVQWLAIIQQKKTS